LPSCRVLPTFPSIVLLTLPPRRGLPGSSSTPLFLLHSQLVDISPFRRRRSPHTCSSFTPPLHHRIHSWNRWFPLTLTLYRPPARVFPMRPGRGGRHGTERSPGRWGRCSRRAEPVFPSAPRRRTIDRWRHPVEFP